mmetsp:Transcript_19805/g.37800  ORF Transcript_19805/g.37800 Transcript_19805/m.37800 type:complete len:227 (-) Transcript_19805:1680-2360(-)
MSQAKLEFPQSSVHFFWQMQHHKHLIKQLVILHQSCDRLHQRKQIPPLHVVYLPVRRLRAMNPENISLCRRLDHNGGWAVAVTTLVTSCPATLWLSIVGAGGWRSPVSMAYSRFPAAMGSAHWSSSRSMDLEKLAAMPIAKMRTGISNATRSGKTMPNPCRLFTVQREYRQTICISVYLLMEDLTCLAGAMLRCEGVSCDSNFSGSVISSTHRFKNLLFIAAEIPR